MNNGFARNKGEDKNRTFASLRLLVYGLSRNLPEPIIIGWKRTANAHDIGSEVAGSDNGVIIIWLPKNVKGIC